MLTKRRFIMLVYGKNVLYELDSKQIKKVYISKKEYLPYLQEHHIKYDYVNNKVLDSKVKGNHQGVVIDMLEYHYYTLDDIDSNFIVILDHLSDPHNFGAIIRTCECIGAANIIIPKDRSVVVNDTVYKTSTGAIENVKIIMVTNLANAIEKLKKLGYFIYCADMDGTDYKKVSYAPKKVLVIGSEGFGVSSIIKKASDEVVSLPMYGKINSLNASVSAGILLYEMGYKND